MDISNPSTSSGIYSAQSGSVQGAGAAAPPNPTLVTAGANLVTVIGEIYSRDGSGPLNTVQAGTLAQAISAFNQAYVAQYGPVPSPLPSPPPQNLNWAQQMEYAINTPLNSDPSSTLLSLSDANPPNTDGLIAFYNYGNNAQDLWQDSLKLRGEIGSPPNGTPIQAPPAVVTAAENLFSSPGLSGAANDIVTIVNGLSEMNPMDTNEQVLLWTLTSPCDPSNGMSLYQAAEEAQSGNTTEFSNMINQLQLSGGTPPQGSEGDWIWFTLSNFNLEQSML